MIGREFTGPLAECPEARWFDFLGRESVSQYHHKFAVLP